MLGSLAALIIIGGIAIATGGGNAKQAGDASPVAATTPYWGHTQPGADSPRDEKENKATGDPGYRAGSHPGASSNCSRCRAVAASINCSGRRAVTFSSRYVRWLPPAERRRHLLRTRRILP